MSHIIQTFGDWKRVNEEDETPGREKQKGKQGNKIVYIPVDRKTLKLKITNETDIIDADGYLRVTSEGVHAFDELLKLIKGQSEIIDYYKGLNDLVNNIVIYDVDVDRGSRKQVITFRIESKTDLTAGDTSKKINSSVRYVRSDQLKRAMEGALINVDKKNPITSDQNVKSKFKLPFSAASIIGSTDANLIQFLVDSYNTIKKDPKAQSSKIMARVKAELQAKKLGVASKLFIKALNAALIIKDSVGLKDATFGEDIEEDITQTLYDFIMNARKALGEANSLYLGLDGDQIFEAESDVIRGFDIDAFISVANTIVPETGDIKVPDAGFTFGMKANAELAKFQKLLYTKLKKIYASSQSYINFAAKTGDGKAGNPVGNYDKTTAALIITLKKNLDNPIWPERDGNTISAEFIKRMQDELKSIKESSKPFVYLGLDGKTVIINEDLGVPDDKVVTKPVVKTQPKPQAKTSGTANTAGVVGPTPSDGKGSAWRYKVVNGQWQGLLTSDKNDTWSLIRNPKYIADLMKTFPNQGGHYLRMKKTSTGWSGLDKSSEVTGYTRKNNKWYLKPVGGNAVELPAGSPAAIDLDNLYVKTGYVTGAPSGGVATTAEIDKDFINLANAIQLFVQGSNNDGVSVEGGTAFNAYVGTTTLGGDDEDAAWDNVMMPEWNTNWSKTLSNIKSKYDKSQVISNTDKARYNQTYNRIKTMFTDTSASADFYNAFAGDNWTTDNFDLLLLLSGSKTERITIDCDFE